VPSIITPHPTVLIEGRPLAPAREQEQTALVDALDEDLTPARNPISIHKLLVSTYRVAGFAILTFILIGLGSYLGGQLFFLGNRSWVAPTIVSPTDERVMQVSAQLAERASQRDRIVAERAAFVAQLNDARRVVSMNMEFQGAFRRALEADLAGRKSELRAVRSLVEHYRRARGEIERSNTAYAGMSRQRLKEEKAAGLIENDQYLSGSYQIAQIANANLSLTEKEVQLKERADSLARGTEAFEAALPQGASGALSYETLKIKQELRRSLLEEERARENAGAYAKSIAALDSVVARYDRLLVGMQESPYLMATERNLPVAFVPYENLKNVRKGAPLYGCRFGMLWCRQVGSIVTVLGAEVSNKHPMRSDMMRGQFVHIELRDAAAAKQKLLFINRRPLFL